MEELEFKMEQICDLIMREYDKYPLIKNTRSKKIHTGILGFEISCDVQCITYKTIVYYYKNHCSKDKHRIMIVTFPSEINMKTLHLDDEAVQTFESEHWYEKEFKLDVEPYDIDYSKLIDARRHIMLRNSAINADKFLTLIKNKLPEKDYVALKMINEGNDKIKTVYNL